LDFTNCFIRYHYLYNLISEFERTSARRKAEEESMKERIDLLEEKPGLSDNADDDE
jgi:hypothetical protein